MTSSTSPSCGGAFATIQSGYGRLTALMASGYLIADAFEILREDPFGSQYIAELLRRLASAE